jgi:hypothetical protein
VSAARAGTGHPQRGHQRLGLHAILRLHTAQEDETYLSLSDISDPVGSGRPAA